MSNEKMRNISVIIPTYNRKEALLDVIKKLLNQDYPKNNYEIVIIDDGSTDGTFDALKEIKTQNFRVFRQKNKGPSAARNLGISKSKYETLAFTDDDCLPKRDWLKQISLLYKNNKNAIGVGGIVYTPIELIKPLTHHALPLKDAIKNALTLKFPPTANVSYKKSEIRKIGGFHEDFKMPTTEDIDLFIRISKIGKVVFNNCLAMPHTAKSSTLKNEIKRFKDFYYGFKIIEELYPEEFKNICVSKSTRVKFAEMSLSFNSLKKIFYYDLMDLLKPSNIVKLFALFVITRLFVLKKWLIS